MFVVDLRKARKFAENLRDDEKNANLEFGPIHNHVYVIDLEKCCEKILSIANSADGALQAHLSTQSKSSSREVAKRSSKVCCSPMPGELAFNMPSSLHRRFAEAGPDGLKTSQKHSFYACVSHDLLLTRL